MPVAFKAVFTESADHVAAFTEQSNEVNASFGAQVHINSIIPSDDAPLMDGEPSAGTDKRYSRGDHRHPHDDTKMNYMCAISNLELEAMLK